MPIVSLSSYPFALLECNISLSQFRAVCQLFISWRMPWSFLGSERVLGRMSGALQNLGVPRKGYPTSCRATLFVCRLDSARWRGSFGVDASVLHESLR